MFLHSEGIVMVIVDGIWQIEILVLCIMVAWLFLYIRTKYQRIMNFKSHCSDHFRFFLGAVLKVQDR